MGILKILDGMGCKISLVLCQDGSVSPCHYTISCAADLSESGQKRVSVEIPHVLQSVPVL